MAVSACGRIGFDGRARDDAGGDDGPITPVTPTLIGINPTQSDAVSMVSSVALFPDGSTAITGSFHGQIELGGRTVDSVATGNSDLYVALIEPDGSARWLLTTGTTGYATGLNILVQGDDVVVGGIFSGTLPDLMNRDSATGQDAVIAVIGSAGGLQTVDHWGNQTNCQLRGMSLSSTKLVKIGLVADSVNFGDGPLPDPGGNDNGWISLSNRDYTQPRSRALLANGDVFPNDVAIATDGSMCITGRFEDQVDFGDGVPLPSTGSSAFLAKYDADLDLVWVKELGPSAVGIGVEIMPNGDCVIAGNFYNTLTSPATSVTSAGDSDAFLGRFSSTTGAGVWMRSFGGIGNDSALDVAADGSNLIVSGFFAATAVLPGGTFVAKGFSDGYLAAVDGNGESLWTQPITGTGQVYEVAGTISVDAENRRVAFGFQFDGEVEFAGTTISNTEEAGAFVVTTLDPQ